MRSHRYGLRGTMSCISTTLTPAVFGYDHVTAMLFDKRLEHHPDSRIRRKRPREHAMRIPDASSHQSSCSAEGEFLAWASIHALMSDLRVDPIPKYSENLFVVVSSRVCPDFLPLTNPISMSLWTSS